MLGLNSSSTPSTNTNIDLNSMPVRLHVTVAPQPSCQAACLPRLPLWTDQGFEAGPEVMTIAADTLIFCGSSARS